MIRDIPRAAYLSNFSKTSCAKNLLRLPHCEERARFRSGDRDEFLIAGKSPHPRPRRATDW
jgi:hypothetical protein